MYISLPIKQTLQQQARRHAFTLGHKAEVHVLSRVQRPRATLPFDDDGAGTESANSAEDADGVNRMHGPHSANDVDSAKGANGASGASGVKGASDAGAFGSNCSQDDARGLRRSARARRTVAQHADCNATQLSRDDAAQVRRNKAAQDQHNAVPHDRGDSNAILRDLDALLQDRNGAAHVNAAQDRDNKGNTALAEIHGVDRYTPLGGNPMTIVRNITLVDKEAGVFLQRFGPNSQGRFKRMMAAFRQGEALFAEMSKVAHCKRRPTARQTATQRSFPHFHLGAWHNQASVTLGYTAETLQKGNDPGFRAVTQFCAWLQTYVGDHLQPYVDNDKWGLCKAFSRQLKERTKTHFPWVADRVQGLEHVCHPFYTTFSVFNGYSGNAHTDSRDDDLSILLNFGQHAMLELPEYARVVRLQPYNVVFFRSSTVQHRTYAHEAYGKGQEGE